MATKSVIEIDVLDDKFKAFAKNFDKYKKALDDQKKSWEEANQTAKKYFDDAQKAQNSFLGNLKTSNKEIKEAIFGFKQIENISTKIARNTFNMATSLGKFLAFGGLAGGFSLTGLLAGITSNASNVRRTSMQYNVSEGGLRAARTAYSRYFDVEGTLPQIASMQTSYDPKAVLARNLLGIGVGQKPEDVLPSAILKAVDYFKTYKGNQQLLERQGITDFIPYEQLRGLANLPAGELQEAAKKYAGYKKQFAGDDTTYKAFQDFSEKLKQAGNEIENKLIVKLKPIEPLLSNMVDKLSTTLASFITSLGNYLASDDFKRDVETIGHAFHWLAQKLSYLFPSATTSATKTMPALTNADKNEMANFKVMSQTWNEEVANQMDPTKRGLGTYALYKMEPLGIRNLNPGNLRFANQPGAVMGEKGFARFSNIEEGEKALATQLRLYQTRDHINTLTDIVKKYAPAGVDGNNPQEYIAYLSKQTGFKSDEQLNLNDPNVLARLMSGISQYETGRTFPVPSMQVIVNNSSGSDLNATLVANAPTGR